MIKACITWAAALFVGTFAWAGGEVGNGGGAFICPDSAQSEFLDLYEARRPRDVADAGFSNSRPALNIPISLAPVEEQIQAAFAKLQINPLVYNAVLETYRVVRAAKINPLPPGVQLAWPSDERNRYIKAGCQAVGVMIFYDFTLSMDQDRVSLEKLPKTDQAAAWVHETLYRFFRLTQGDRDSIRTREVVAYLFSDKNSPELVTALKRLGLRLELGSAGLTSFGENLNAYVVASVSQNPSEFVSVPLSYRIRSLNSVVGCDPHAEFVGNYTIEFRQDSIGGIYRFPLHRIFYGDVEWSKYALSHPACSWTIALADIYGKVIRIPFDSHNLTLPFFLPGTI